MTIILGVILFFFGTIIGSFLNVVIYRFNTGKTLGGRSMCLSCGKTLHWHELVPLVSYIMLRGKCSKCKSKISIQYPLVETTTGIMFVFLAFAFMRILDISQPLFLVTIVTYVYIWCLMLTIAVYDIRHTIIPEKLVWLLNALAFVALFVFLDYRILLHVPTLISIIAGPLLALPFWALWFGSGGKWMGLGDAKLVLAIGWLLGPSMGLIALFFAFWIGGLYSILLLLIKGRKYTMHSAIPFGPFLVLGAFIVFVFSVKLLSFAALFSF
jgi:prepilin signal peptidase PulO-like enzyme (type II secretory pathway)